MRSLLYFLAKLLGDASAIKKGRVRQRVERRVTGRLTAQLLGRLHRGH